MPRRRGSRYLSKGLLAPDLGWHIVNFATSAVLEETLRCSSTSAAQIANIVTAVPNVQDYQEACDRWAWSARCIPGAHA